MGRGLCWLEDPGRASCRPALASHHAGSWIHYGFRKSELLSLKVGQVDLLARTTRLNPGETKNGKDRVVTLTEACYRLVVQLVRGKRTEDSLLTRASAEPVKENFRGVSCALVRAAGVPGLLFHDLRRSAVRNMVRRGVTETVAMRISGHKRGSVFDRYDIVDESDLGDAALKVERAGKDELARADSIDSPYIEPAKSEVGSREQNARKPS